MARSLVIVESPAKAEDDQQVPGPGLHRSRPRWDTCATCPSATLGVDEQDLRAHLPRSANKKKTLAELRKAAEDGRPRSSWPPTPTARARRSAGTSSRSSQKETDAPTSDRVMFNEITQARRASTPSSTREIDIEQGRRPAGAPHPRSAGRLQDQPAAVGQGAAGLSRPGACRASRCASSASASANWLQVRRVLVADGEPGGREPPTFQAQLVARDGKKIEPNPRSGRHRGARAIGLAHPRADGRAPGATRGRADPRPSADFRVGEASSRKQREKNPLPPFITSKLQQDAAATARLPGLAARCALAQRLYEGLELGEDGRRRPHHLHAHRLDAGLRRRDRGPCASSSASDLRRRLRCPRSRAYLPDRRSGRRTPTRRSARPRWSTLRDRVARLSEPDELRLYTLIWNRFVASQMEPRSSTDRADIEAGRGCLPRHRPSVARRCPAALPSTTRRATRRRRETPTRSPTTTRTGACPRLVEGEAVTLRDSSREQHFTQPPPRFSEATLVKELEEKGIGRPSTYAAILSTIQDRGYVEKEAGALFPTELGVMVNGLMVGSSPTSSIDFTAQMEEELDQVEEGELTGSQACASSTRRSRSTSRGPAIEMRDVKREEIPTDQICEKCGKPMVIKWGRNGHFLACSGYPECKNTREVNRGTRPASRRLAAAANRRPSRSRPSPIRSRPKPSRARSAASRWCCGAAASASSWPAPAIPSARRRARCSCRKEGKAEAKPDVLLDETCPQCQAQLGGDGLPAAPRHPRKWRRWPARSAATPGRSGRSRRAIRGLAPCPRASRAGS